MANWKNKLEIGDLHRAYQSQELSITELAIKLADRLVKAPFYLRHKNILQSIILDLADVESVDNYDNCLEALYDWADVNHNCWLNP